jgi:tetratricopeptide (TPR) repeat protein
MMKLRLFTMMKALQLSAFAIMLALASGSYAAQDYGAQDKNKDQAPQANKGEQDAVLKVRSAPDVQAKLKAAGEFVKKYPKSTQRAAVVGHVMQEINKIPDATQKISLLENSLTVFKEQSDADIINPILIDAYLKAKRLDDAFRAASAAIAKNPNDLVTLTQMSLVGVDEAKHKNPKYLDQSQQYGLKSIELIEAGKKPDNMDDAEWKDYQTRLLPSLYQSMGIISLMGGKKDEAKTRIEKAMALNADDPFTYVLIGGLIDDEFQKLAEQHKAQSSGPLKDELLRQALAKMDQVIEIYAHAVALSEGSEPYKPLHDQVFDILQNYYKYRHAGSINGLTELIAKYKKQ